MCSNIRFKCEQKLYPICNLWYYEQLYGIMWTWSQCQAMFTSYCIGFCSVSQNYGMMWTHFPFNIYVEYEFKNFGHYFNVFWWKKQPSEKKTRESKAIDSNNKRMSKVLKINFVLSDDEIQFLQSLANSNFGCYCSRPA